MAKAKKRKQKRGFFKFTGLDRKEYKLTLKEKNFCEAYLEWKADGVEAVYKAGYNPKNRKVAAQMAYALLIKVDIVNYINLKLEEYGMNDSNVERQHLFVLNQLADLKAKNKAVEMFYRKKGEYGPEKRDPDITVNINITSDEADKAKKRVKVKKGKI